MATVTQDKYSPYPRVCDVCGQLRSINTMRKLDNITWVCSKHTGERTKIMLDTLNAHARPPQTWPTEDPKPQNPEYPNRLEADEGALFSFIDRMIVGLSRYESVDNGSSPLPDLASPIQMRGWAARYLYGLIVENTRTPMIARAKLLLNAVAAQLRNKQYGSSTGFSPSATRATSAFFGGIAEISTPLFTEDTIAGGLAMLYAYRVLGTASYLDGARSAASYLRNVQAIGSNGTNFTSSDAAGVTRFYTGTLASEVDDASGFYSNHLFYPSALMALEFWKELTTTDGDQSIGATAAVTGFDTAPAQLMSTSMTELRNCWTNGIRQVDTVTVVGLSSTTPREFFNAYPATKTNFPNITGTGMWEYADGTAAVGSRITSESFGNALGALYAYEGATTQVTSILTWLQGFESNETYETPDDTSDSTLARSTTGEFDATIAMTTAMDAEDEVNGSSVYDWGAFGYMSALIASQNMSYFKRARLVPLNQLQRFDDGMLSDGLIFDRPQLRGLSGLDGQTGFKVDVSIVSIAPVAFNIVRGRGGIGSNLEFDTGVSVPEGELTRFDFWHLTTIDDNDGRRFPYKDAVGEIPDGGTITLYNNTGAGLLFNHLATSTDTDLEFSLITESTVTVPIGYLISFVRDDDVWRQLWVPTRADGSYPFHAVNDAVRAARFGLSYRISH